MEKEIEELREQIKREGNSSILKFGPPQDDEQDEFQLSEVDKQAAEEVLVTLAQETKVAFLLFFFDLERLRKFEQSKMWRKS